MLFRFVAVFCHSSCREMEVIEGTKKRRISHEEYFYTQDSARGDTIYMKCSQKTSKSCKGRAVVENGVVTPTKATHIRQILLS